MYIKYLKSIFLSFLYRSYFTIRLPYFYCTFFLAKWFVGFYLYFFVFFTILGSVSRSTPDIGKAHKPHIFANYTNWSISSTLSPSLVFRHYFSLPSIPSLIKIRPTVRSHSKLSLLILLSGDISTNPGPTSHFKISCANAQSVRRSPRSHWVKIIPSSHC